MSQISASASSGWLPPRRMPSRASLTLAGTSSSAMRACQSPAGMAMACSKRARSRAEPLST
ncbi:conserved hypothetical protein [Ricinus communis]|uniref:Uncharacterized protein n=1 Tax=Ricinus communis TaxID=3988 RepID=B9TM26_RICCO|nr:conserved hypothetical protein [Ricinus communis]